MILVDRGTLGAAEVFATVLRQKQKAELVGERTFGHAGRQGTAELSSGGRLLFTEAFYTGPDKKPLNEALKPDLLVDERQPDLSREGHADRRPDPAARRPPAAGPGPRDRRAQGRLIGTGWTRRAPEPPA